MDEKDHSSRPQLRNEASAPPVPGSVKGQWVKPEIIDYKPVTVARAISYRLGDGISNLS